MYSLDAARQLFAFDRWANERLVVALNQTDDPSEELRSIAWHLFAAIENWSSRIDGTRPAVDLEWEAHSLEEITALSDHVGGRTDEDQSGLLDGAEHRGQCWLLMGEQDGPVRAPEPAWYRLGQED